MNRKITASFLLCSMMLTACGETVGTAYDVPQTETTAVTTTTKITTTTAVTTTQPKADTSTPEDVDISVDDAVEVYEQITVGDVIKADNITLENADELLDTDKLGKHSATVKYTYEGRKYENKIQYTVEDTTPPLLLNSGWNPVAKLGEEFDLNKFVGFADNYDPKPELTYEGFVDTSVCGIYPLTATATDSSGNETTWDVSIEVAEEVPEYVNTDDRIPFEDYVQQYGGENISFGLDISEWQGYIDFDAVRDAGCSFVIMRMGHFYDNLNYDEQYHRNIQAAKDAGLQVGVYIYTTANTEEEVIGNAKWIADTLDGTELDFPVVFDWEEFGTFQEYEMSIHDLNNYFTLFADEMESYGYSAMLYSSKNFLNDFWYENPKYPVWLAHYTDETDYEGEYVMWQTTNVGRIDGIDADADFNILYTDRYEEFAQ